MSFKYRLFISFSAIFVVFTLLVMIFQYDREKKFKIAQLENTLDNITETAHNYMASQSIGEEGTFYLLDSLMEIVPAENIRLTVINPFGQVMYDSEVRDYMFMENHLDRPEVMESIGKASGSAIRESATTGNSYYYYSKHYQDYFVRTATLYDVQIRDFLHVERLFVFYLLNYFSLNFTNNTSKTTAARTHAGRGLPGPGPLRAQGRPSRLAEDHGERLQVQLRDRRRPAQQGEHP